MLFLQIANKRQSYNYSTSKQKTAMRNIIYIVLLCLFLLPSSLFATGDRLATLVIDPGHGGKDPGCVGLHSCEKNVALAVALKFGQMVSEQFPDVKVIYTRKDDRFVELRQRGTIANKNHADLFVSIHCNATESKEAKGVETWIMGSHKNEANLKVAKLENSAILQEQDHQKNYDNFDPNSPDAYIIFSLYQNAFMDQSLNFAGKIQDQYMSRMSTPNRGIKQAGFIVLWSCALPSVLTEIGFISNPAEEQFLISEDGQNKIATSLFQAFKEYKYQVEGFNNQNQIDQTDPSPSNNKSTKTASAIPTSSAPSTATATSVSAADLIREQAQKAQIEEAQQAQNQQTQQNKQAQQTTQQTTPQADSAQKPKIIFKVQFATSSTNKDVNSPEFRNLYKISKYNENGLYKYCSGEATTATEAQKNLQKTQEAGFKDAFIVVFMDGKRISTQEAFRILQE